MDTINTITDLLKIALDENTDVSFYRGHSNTEYSLKPSIGRNSTKFDKWLFEIEKSEEVSDAMKISAGLQQYEWWALSEFKAKKTPFHNENLNYFDLMILAQHHGLRTRLLDVTTNPLVALYFACENESVDGELICFNKSWSKIKVITTGINDELPNMVANDIRGFLLFIRNLDNYSYVIPSHLSDRIISQNGSFIMFKQPLQEILNGENIQKLKIPKDRKLIIKRELRKLGFTKSKIYPDLNSIASEIDSNLFEQ
jgi:hypothetical protein